MEWMFGVDVGMEDGRCEWKTHPSSKRLGREDFERVRGAETHALLRGFVRERDVVVPQGIQEYLERVRGDRVPNSHTHHTTVSNASSNSSGTQKNITHSIRMRHTVSAA
jgi:hypothetical protein